jgi:hypothetical protein
MDILRIGDRKDLKTAIKVFEADDENAMCLYNSDARYCDAVGSVFASARVAQCNAVFCQENMGALFAELPPRIQFRRWDWDEDWYGD